MTKQVRECRNCRAWDRIADRNTGYCKCKAPTLCTDDSYGRFPMMYSKNWCLEWRSKV